MSRRKYSCDFETTTKLDDCRVWAYGWMEIGNTSNSKIGNSMDEFMEWLTNINSDVYFHNLKFDGSFIINWLMKNGYKYSKNGEAKTFKSVISKMGQWYMIDISNGYKGKKKIHTVVYDSLKKLPFPVKSIAKDFKLHVEKGDIDYHLERPEGYEITDDEMLYINNDIEIIAAALEIQFGQGLTGMTNGRDSLDGFKDVFSTKMFDKHFPKLSLSIDNDIRKAYRGGFTWLNKKYYGLTLDEGMVFDVNSLYPAIMYDRLLPYGFPLPFNGEYIEDKNYPLYIQHIRCEFILKEGYIPTIQIKGNKMFKGNDYLHDSNGEIVDLYLSNVDMKMFFEHYDVFDIEYLNGWKFKGKRGMFNQFIEKWTYIKINNEGAIKALAKLMLNSLYGKFATNPDIQGKEPFLKTDGSNGFVLGDEEFKDPVYTAMGVLITSYARELTIGTAQACYDRIIYCDTDSIHLVGTEIPEAIKDIIDGDKLGFWDHESNFKRAKYVRQKTYVQDLYEKQNEKGKWVKATKHDFERIKFSVKCAGMPDSIKEKVKFEDFNVGFTSMGKLAPKQVSGGVVLVDTAFTIK